MLWLAVATALAAVAALVVTGFFVPGFLLADGDSDTTPETLAMSFTRALKEHDPERAEAMLCESAATPAHQTVITLAGRTTPLTLAGVPQRLDDGTYVAAISSPESSHDAVLADQTHRWCVADLLPVSQQAVPGSATSTGTGAREDSATARR
ncbi:hypothetical protein GCM10009754_73150 [Amycolatopsis minnesotensis]|uniref:Uncharacterized protein n=2 Tax=Amycolatopsis minnesotensis TaxID=337894 RepID=A0ABN2SFA5_9PSEU